MNICSIDDDGRFGGPQKRNIEVAKALIPYDINTTILYPKHDTEKFSNELKNKNIKSESITIHRISFYLSLLLNYFKNFFSDIYRIRRKIKDGNFDIVLINGTPQYKSAISGILAKLPVVWIFEDTQMPSIVKWLSKLLAYRFAASIIVTGRSVYDYYIANTPLSKKYVEIIPAPVDTREFSKTNSANYVNSKKIKIVTVAGIIPVKGVEIFVEMADELSNNEYLEFLIAGGEMESQQHYARLIKNLIDKNDKIRDRVKLLGMVDDVKSFLNESDIFVCTSHSEAGPITVWEAMSMSMPIVTTNVGSVSDYIINGESGFIVPVGDVTSLAAKVSYLVDNPGIWNSLGKKARKIAEEKLDVDVASRKYNALYRRIVTAEYKQY